MPRTESRKKRSGRFCGDCGYELARDNDGPCPMCPRFEQLRTVPRPSDLAAHQIGSRDANHSGHADEWPPTVAEYRAILAERRLKLASEGQHAATVIRTPALRQIQVPPAPRGAAAPGDGALTSPAKPKPQTKDLASPSAKKAKARRGQGEGRRPPRDRARSSIAVDDTAPGAIDSSLAPPTSAVVPATPGSPAAPKAVEAQSGTAVPTGNKMLATPRRVTRPLPHAIPMGYRASRSRTGATWRLVALATVLAASALIGAAVPLLLSY